MIDYQISYDQSSGVYQVIGIGISSRSFQTTLSQVIGPGITYTFKVQARNAIGLSEHSVELSVLAAVLPD